MSRILARVRFAGLIHALLLGLAVGLAQAQSKGEPIVIGQSATHQISHTKGFVADGRVAGEGSTNWSDAGEGTFIVKGAPGGPGFKAQNNTQSIITDPDTISRFSAQLVAEHLIAQRQAAGTGLGVTPSQSGKPTQRREPSSARVATASGRRASTAR